MATVSKTIDNNTPGPCNNDKKWRGMMELPSGYEPRSNDVICARGVKVMHHEGNIRYRKLVVDNLERYRSCKSRGEKTQIIQSVVEAMRAGKGMFVSQSENDGRWFALGETMTRVRVGQCFRNFRFAEKKRRFRDGEDMEDDNDMNHSSTNTGDAHTGQAPTTSITATDSMVIRTPLAMRANAPQFFVPTQQLQRFVPQLPFQVQPHLQIHPQQRQEVVEETKDEPSVAPPEVNQDQQKSSPRESPVPDTQVSSSITNRGAQDSCPDDEEEEDSNSGQNESLSGSRKEESDEVDEEEDSDEQDGRYSLYRENVPSSNSARVPSRSYRPEEEGEHSNEEDSCDSGRYEEVPASSVARNGRSQSEMDSDQEEEGTEHSCPDGYSPLAETVRPNEVITSFTPAQAAFVTTSNLGGSNMAQHQLPVISLPLPSLSWLQPSIAGAASQFPIGLVPIGANTFALAYLVAQPQTLTTTTTTTTPAASLGVDTATNSKMMEQQELQARLPAHVSGLYTQGSQNTGTGNSNATNMPLYGMQPILNPTRAIVLSDPPPHTLNVCTRNGTAGSWTVPGQHSVPLATTTVAGNAMEGYQIPRHLCAVTDTAQQTRVGVNHFSVSDYCSRGQSDVCAGEVAAVSEDEARFSNTVAAGVGRPSQRQSNVRLSDGSSLQRQQDTACVAEALWQLHQPQSYVQAPSDVRGGPSFLQGQNSARANDAAPVLGQPSQRHVFAHAAGSNGRGLPLRRLSGVNAGAGSNVSARGRARVRLPLTGQDHQQEFLPRTGNWTVNGSQARRTAH